MAIVVLIGTPATSKTIKSFPTVETTDFTVPNNSDRNYQDCDFSVETEVTINLTSIKVEGEVLYFAMLGDGQINFIPGVDINDIEFNSLQSAVVGSKGDIIGIMLKPNGVLKIV